MQTRVSSRILVRFLGNKKYPQRARDLDKDVVLTSQKYSLMLRGAAVRCNTEEFIQNLTNATDITTHPEYFYPALYATMTTSWIDNFNVNQVYTVLDKLARLKFNCSEYIVTDSMKKSLFTKKKVDNHLLEQRIVICRLFNRIMSFSDLNKPAEHRAPVTIIKGLDMLTRCHLKWDHIVSYRQQFSTSNMVDSSTIMDPLAVIIPHLSCVEIRELLQALQQLNVKWVDLSEALQRSLINVIADSSAKFSSNQAVDVIFTLGQMELSLVALLQTNINFCNAVLKKMTEALLDGTEIRHATYTDQVLSSMVAMNLTYAHLPVSLNRAVDKCINCMPTRKLRNMTPLLLALKVDLSRLDPEVVAVIRECQNQEEPSLVFISPGASVSAEVPSSPEVVKEVTNDSMATARSTDEAAEASTPSSSGSSLFSSLFSSSYSEEQESVCEIEDLIHEELARAYKSGNDKQFIESLKAVLDEVDLNAPTRQKYFSNELLFLRYLTPEWIKRLQPDLIPDLMECLILMRCGFNMMEKKFLWTAITQYFNKFPDFPSVEDRNFVVFMNFLESISTFFNQHEVLNAFKVLAAAKISWSAVPSSTQTALMRALDGNAQSIVAKDAALLLNCLVMLELNVQETIQISAEDRQSCHHLVGNIAAKALGAFETDLRFAIGGHRAAAQVVKQLSEIHFTYSLMDKPLIHLIKLHVSSVLKRRQIVNLHETIAVLAKMKFQYDHIKPQLLPALFEPYLTGSADCAALLNGTLDSLCGLKVTYDTLSSQYQKLLMQCVRQSLASVDQTEVDQLVKRLQSVNLTMNAETKEVFDDAAGVIPAAVV